MGVTAWVTPMLPSLMIIKPPKLQGIIIGSVIFILLVGGIIFGILQLTSDEISPLLGVWVFIIVFGTPLLLMVGYRLYGLATARYVLNRDGFSLQWGFSFEQIPISTITNILKGEEITIRLKPSLGISWPGCVVGQREVENFGRVEFFATAPTSRQIIIPLEKRSLVISPPDVEAFHQSFLDAVRMGALEEIPPVTSRPDFFSARLWADLWARSMIILGLLLILLLLGYLAFRVPHLPASVPFGFDLMGRPNLLVLPSQLLLLPIVGGFCWLADFVIGIWLYRQEQNRQVAYVVWFTGIVLGGLLWGAVFHLLTAS
jgi:hypothetical protein